MATNVVFLTSTDNAYFRQCFFPNMLVIILMNSWYLGVNIGMGTTYATLLEAPPYNWAPKWVGVAQAGQIVVAFIALPALGIFSDKLITYMAKRNDGVHERKSRNPVCLHDTYLRLLAETRLIPLAFPVALGVLSTVLFGAGYAHPEKFHWFVIIFSYCGSYFAFSKSWVAATLKLPNTDLRSTLFSRCKRRRSDLPA